MKKLLVVTLLITCHQLLTAGSASCHRLLDMLAEQPDLQSTFVATQEYQQCTLQKNALNTIIKSPKPEHALVVSQQLVHDGHKVTSDHVEQCMHAYWASRYQAGRITSVWTSSANLPGLRHAYKWTTHALHYVRLAHFLTNAHADTRNPTMERFKRVDFDRIADDRVHEVRLVEQALHTLQ